MAHIFLRFPPQVIFSVATLFTLLSPVLPKALQAQSETEAVAFTIQEVFAKALTDQAGVAVLRGLAQDIGARPAGSPGYANAVTYCSRLLAQQGLSTSKQPVTVVPWKRGRPASATLQSAEGRRALRVTALGNSPASPPGGVHGEVVEVRSLAAVDSLGDALKGKVVFFNRPFDAGRVNTFEGYGNAVDQRVRGPERAAKYGAAGAVVRSMNPGLDRVPHTGTTVFDAGNPKIPAVAISTADAELLHTELSSSETPLVLSFQSGGEILPATTDHNLIADWRGTRSPDDIILIGAHLDSWDAGEGAHDDGAGVAHVIEAISLLKATGFQPKHTLRVVLFANEENGLSGAKAYWNLTDSLALSHVAAIESDRGGFAPRGFSVAIPDGTESSTGKLTSGWQPLLEPYGLHFSKGGGGADISGLLDRGTILFGLATESQRYFDYHHSSRDRFSEVHPRELELGAASIASLVMLLDRDL